MRYETPLGSFDNWESAAQACEACDMDATLCVNIVDDSFSLERAPAVEPAPKTFENTTGEQLTMFAKGSDWKPRHRDLFDVEEV